MSARYRLFLMLALCLAPLLLLSACNLVEEDDNETTPTPDNSTGAIDSPTTAPDNPAAEDPISYVLIAEGAHPDAFQAVGCGDSAVAVRTDIPRSTDTAENIRASLQAMLNLEYGTHGDGLLRTDIGNLDVVNVTIEGRRAIVRLTGDATIPIGTCGDARRTAQVALSIFQYPDIDEALVLVDGRNLAQIYDTARGDVGAEDPFLRERFIY